jgi:hypothetical protein
MLYPPPEGTGILCTKADYIKFCAASANNFAEDQN